MSPRDYARNGTESFLMILGAPVIMAGMIVAAFFWDSKLAFTFFDLPRRCAEALFPRRGVNPGEPDPRD